MNSFRIKILVGSIFGTTATSLFVVEHVMRKKFPSRKRPSQLLSLASEYSQNFWSNLGKWIAKLSNISKLLTYVPIQDLYETGKDLISPIFNLTFSWIMILPGYLQALNNMQMRILVVSSTIGAGVGIFFIGRNYSTIFNLMSQKVHQLKN